MDIISIVLLFFIVMALLLIVFTYNRTSICAKLTLIRKQLVRGQSLQGQVIDYNTYIMPTLEWLVASLLAAALLFTVGYIFYQNIILALLLTPFCVYYPKIRTRQIIRKRKDELKLQFKDALQSLSSSLHAGKSFETSMKSAIADLLIQYEHDSYIVQELEIIVRKLESNETVERAFSQFADRSGLEEIQSFAEILEICKRTGGNLIVAIKSSTDIISEKIEVMNDIQGILAQKKLEQNILSVLPIMLVFLLSTSARDFMAPVFTEVIGRVVMTISMALFVLAYFISGKITDIEV